MERMKFYEFHRSFMTLGNKLYLLRALFVLILLFPNCAYAALLVSNKYKYYAIDPRSIDDLLPSLNRASPIQEDGETFHGHTYTHIKWNFRWRSGSNRCWIESVRTEVAVTFTLPQLQNHNVEINVIWNQWYPKLLIHEENHKNNGIQTAENIEQSIQNMHAYSSCDELEMRANEIGYDYIAKLKKLNDNYDKRTNHGESEGASLSTYLNQ